MSATIKRCLEDTSCSSSETPWPPNLRQRGSGSTITSAIVFAAYCLFIVVCTTIDSAFPDPYPNLFHRVTYMLCAVTFGIAVLILAELLYRTILLVEELRHRDTVRYRDLRHLFCEVYSFKMGALWITLLFVSLIMVLLMLLHNDVADYVTRYLKDNIILLVTQLVLNSVILAMIGLRGPSNVELSKLVEKKHLSVAHGLAWSYYMGYLRIVAPDFVKRLTELQLHTQGSSVIPKMVILLPDTCHNPQLVGENDPNIRYVRDVIKEEDRAGKSKRSFSQPVYKITHGQNTYFCVVEYSASLLTLREMCAEDDAGFSMHDMKYEMSIFYSTLEKILKAHSYISDHVLLLPYQENKIQDGHPLSQLLVDAIHEVEPIPMTNSESTC